MAAISLTPSGHLRWEQGERTELAPLGRVFDADWREGLFRLAADRIDTSGSPTLGYWQEMAERYVSGLCHIPREAVRVRVEPPTPAERDSRVLMAPPMSGGEYLTQDVLLAVWEELDRWGAEAADTEGGLEGFLRERAPKWRPVGRVCFHLAENKQNPGRPFAFMASYTLGLRRGRTPEARTVATGPGAVRRREEPARADQSADAGGAGSGAMRLGPRAGRLRARSTSRWRGRRTWPTAS